MKNVFFKKIISVLVLLVSIALFALYFINALLVKNTQTFAVIGFSILGLIVGYVVTTIFHEIGHLVLGAICKLKLAYFKVFGLKFYRDEGGKLKVSFEPDGNAFGETAFIPTTANAVATKIGFTALGGPIFTLLQTILQFVVVLTCFDNTVIFCLFGLSFVVPLYVLLINVIPFSQTYDGYLAFTLLLGGKKGLIASAYITAETQIASGLTPQEIDGRLLSVYSDNYDYFSVKIIRLRYLASLLTCEETAFLELDKISDLDSLPDGTFAEVLYEQFFKAITVGDEDFITANADEVFDYLDLDDSPTAIRVQIAYLIYVGEYERAKLLIESGLKILENYSNLGMAKFEREIIEGFKTLLNAE